MFLNIVKYWFCYFLFCLLNLCKVTCILPFEFFKTLIWENWTYRLMVEGNNWVQSSINTSNSCISTLLMSLSSLQSSCRNMSTCSGIPSYGSFNYHLTHRPVHEEITYMCSERARARNGKYGPVDLSKNENDWGLKDDYSANESLLMLCLCLWRHFLTSSCIMTSKIASLSQIYDFCIEISKISILFYHFLRMP